MCPRHLAAYYSEALGVSASAQRVVYTPLFNPFRHMGYIGGDLGFDLPFRRHIYLAPRISLSHVIYGFTHTATCAVETYTI